jgi:hypothetical protein
MGVYMTNDKLLEKFFTGGTKDMRSCGYLTFSQNNLYSKTDLREDMPLAMRFPDSPSPGHFMLDYHSKNGGEYLLAQPVHKTYYSSRTWKLRGRHIQQVREAAKRYLGLSPFEVPGFDPPIISKFLNNKATLQFSRLNYRFNDLLLELKATRTVLKRVGELKKCLGLPNPVIIYDVDRVIDLFNWLLDNNKLIEEGQLQEFQKLLTISSLLSLKPGQ